VFIGHFALAFAAKRAAPAASLGTLVLAAQFLDGLWPVFVLAGIERVEIAPGITAVTPLDFVSYPYSHSLLATAVWAGLFGGTYLAVRRNSGAALVLAALVLSHWLLDAASHRPDMPLVPGGGTRVGLGLWNSLPATLAVEGLLFAGCLWSYLSFTRANDRTGSLSLWTLVVVLLLAYLGAVFGPPPPSVDAVAYSGLLGWGFVAWGYWIDRHRSAAPVAVTA
jgi:hypothetical protein